MNYNVILIRYGELALKSPYVRQVFESILIKNIKKAHRLENISHIIKKERGRIYLITADISKSITILPRIFGIVSFSPAIQTVSTMENISFYALRLIKNILTKEKSFAIRSTRIGNHHFTSQDVAIQIGNDIVNSVQAKVDLTHPDIELFIEIRNKNSFLFTEKIRGVGGLPLGAQSKVLSIIENPNSLLAAWYLMRRGCNIIIVNLKKSNEESIHSFLSFWYADAEIIFLDPAKESFYHRLSVTASQKKCDAIIIDHNLETLTHSLSVIANLKKKSSLPILTPLISLTQKQIQKQCKKRGIL